MDRAEVEEAACAAGADEPIRRLPHGFETLLAKWSTGGTEPSFGEWQCPALARAFLRQAPLILLDEPTCALDSWAEADWLDRFRSMAAGRTALIITHRFTTAMRADVIHVMAESQIAEWGSHTELLARGDLYARSWEVQTRGDVPARAPRLICRPVAAPRPSSFSARRPRSTVTSLLVSR
ncbi:MAG TPA: hypothetical protein VH592_09310 [Gemmataceae bacterium]|jgi:ATP-binding cassette subfamily B protein